MENKETIKYFVSSKFNFYIVNIIFWIFLVLFFMSLVCGLFIYYVGYLFSLLFLGLILNALFGKFNRKFSFAKYSLDKNGITFYWNFSKPITLHWQEIKKYSIKKPNRFYRNPINFVLYLSTTPEEDIQEYSYYQSNTVPNIYCIAWDKENAKILLPYIQFYLNHTLK